MSKTDKFISKANLIHNDRYGYTNVEYSTAKTKVSIKCHRHGIFMQTPNDHLSGKGCPVCARERTTASLAGSIDDFKASVKAKFGDVYDYTNSVYITYKHPIEVTCKKCSQVILGKPTNLLKRKNPCSCAIPNYGGFKKYLPAILYYIKVAYKDDVAYKIGITNKSVKERFKRDINNGAVINIIQTWNFPHGGDAYDIEAKIKADFKVYKWDGSDLLIDGNTELFDRDILEIDEGKSSE